MRSFVIDAQVEGAHDFALAHGDSPKTLRRVLADCEERDACFKLPAGSVRVPALHISHKLSDRLHVGGEPGEAMGGALMKLRAFSVDTPFDQERLAHSFTGMRKKQLRP